MVIRLILRYLANNEQLVQRLSESYPIQRAARFVAYVFTRTKQIADDPAVKEKLDAEKLKRYARRFSENVKEEIRNVKDELGKKRR